MYCTFAFSSLLFCGSFPSSTLKGTVRRELMVSCVAFNCLFLFFSFLFFPSFALGSLGGCEMVECRVVTGYATAVGAGAVEPRAHPLPPPPQPSPSPFSSFSSLLLRLLIVDRRRLSLSLLLSTLLDSKSILSFLSSFLPSSFFVLLLAILHSIRSRIRIQIRYRDRVTQQGCHVSPTYYLGCAFTLATSSSSSSD